MTILFAGMGSHQSGKSVTDNWFTPPAIIEALGGAGSFDLDPCSGADRPFATALHHFSPEDNGLRLNWWGRIWLNPPYSNPLLARFLARMAAHGRGTALIFARTETAAFRRFVWSVATGVMFLNGRLNFHHADGRRAIRNGGAPSVLIAYGDDDRDILAAAPIDGTFIPLRLPTTMLVSWVNATWAQALESFFAGQDGPVSLGDLYRAFANHPKSRSNQHWKDKLRQMLQRGTYERVDKGLWQRRAA